MDSMVLVTDWNFRSNEDSRAPAEEADEEEALLLPPPPPAAIFPVCTSAAASPAAAAATAAAGAGAAKQSLRVRESRRWGGRPRGGDGARARLFWSGGEGYCRARWRLLHAARRGCGLINVVQGGSV